MKKLCQSKETHSYQHKLYNLSVGVKENHHIVFAFEWLNASLTFGEAHLDPARRVHSKGKDERMDLGMDDKHNADCRTGVGFVDGDMSFRYIHGNHYADVTEHSVDTIYHSLVSMLSSRPLDHKNQWLRCQWACRVHSHHGMTRMQNDPNGPEDQVKYADAQKGAHKRGLHKVKRIDHMHGCCDGSGNYASSDGHIHYRSTAHYGQHVFDNGRKQHSSEKPLLMKMS